MGVIESIIGILIGIILEFIALILIIGVTAGAIVGYLFTKMEDWFKKIIHAGIKKIKTRLEK